MEKNIEKSPPNANSQNFKCNSSERISETNIPIVNNEYISPTPDAFPIICWGGFNTDKEEALLLDSKASSVPEEYKAYVRKEVADIVECGFNVATRIPYAHLYNAIEFAIKEKNLGIICTFPDAKDPASETGEYVQLASLPDKCLEFAQDVLNKCNQDSIKAWLLGDEPHFDNLVNWQESYDRLQNLITDKMIFPNLNADKASYNIGNLASYDAYLGLIRKMFRPGVWSYDLYPIRQASNGSIYVSKAFYSRLESFANAANSSGRPFWAFCQCLAVAFVSGADSLPTPTVSRMRFEAFSALAYGAQGISYWSFLHRKPNQSEIYSDAAIDESGNRTETWNAIKAVNSEIRRYANVFLGAEFVEAKHTGDGNWDGVEPFNEPIGPLVSVISGDVLVSHLVNSKKNYLVIVSHYPDRSQEIKLAFDANSNVHNVLVPTSIIDKEEDIDVEKVGAVIVKPIKTLLLPGGYVVYEWS